MGLVWCSVRPMFRVRWVYCDIGFGPKLLKWTILVSRTGSQRRSKRLDQRPSVAPGIPIVRPRLLGSVGIGRNPRPALSRGGRPVRSRSCRIKMEKRLRRQSSLSLSLSSERKRSKRAAEEGDGRRKQGNIWGELNESLGRCAVLLSLLVSPRE